MNTPVSPSLAKLLKEKGYENDDCENVYLGDFDEEYPPEKIEVSTRGLRQRTLGEFDYIAPSISDVIMWLYEKHDYWCYTYTNGKIWHPCIQHKFGDMAVLSGKIGQFNSLTEAYEAAIEYTLNNLI